MSRHEEPPRIIDSDPLTTPLPAQGVRTLGGHPTGDPVTSKITVPGPRKETTPAREQRDEPAEEPRERPKPAAERHRRSKPAPRPRAAVLLTSVLIGAIVSVGLGVYGRMHEPTGYAVNLAGFSGPGYVKAWLASVSAVFALLQPITAKLMYRRKGAPGWVAGLHRWSGRIAVLVSVPVAMHCLFAFGFQADSTRVLLHSLAGCLFYGAFTTKMLSLTRPGTPKWAVPLFGGLVFTILVALWASSAFWLFSKQGVHL